MWLFSLVRSAGSLRHPTAAKTCSLVRGEAWSRVAAPATEALRPRRSREPSRSRRSRQPEWACATAGPPTARTASCRPRRCNDRRPCTGILPTLWGCGPSRSGAGRRFPLDRYHDHHRGLAPPADLRYPYTTIVGCVCLRIAAAGTGRSGTQEDATLHRAELLEAGQHRPYFFLPTDNGVRTTPRATA